MALYKKDIMEYSKMHLHGYFRSSASYRIRIALNYKKIKYENIEIDLSKNEQNKINYLLLNPQGLVPLLETTHGNFIQSLAVIEYLEDIYPEPNLLPKDPIEKQRVRALSQMIACEIQPLNNLRVLNYLTNECHLNEKQKISWYTHWISIGFEAIEKKLKNESFTGIFCHGDKPTMADICLVPQVYNAKRFNCDLTKYPIIQRIDATCQEILFFQKADPKFQPDAITI